MIRVFILPIRFLLAILMLGGSSTAVIANDSPSETQCVSASQLRGDSFKFRRSDTHTMLAARLPDTFTIGEIRFQRFNVFDEENPRENHRIYRWANDFHSLTQESVIRSQLLFSSGDSVQPRSLEESERLLRDLKFIYDASVRPFRICGDVVDVEVVTRDVWTFTPSISFSRSGGGNDLDIGLRDTSFLGSGKHLEFKHESDDERSGDTLIYRDPAIMGSRYQAHLAYTDNDDGDFKLIDIKRPFFALDTEWAGGLRLDEQSWEDTLHFRGDKVAEFDHEMELHGAFVGISQGVIGNKSKRWQAGLQLEKHNFDFSDTNKPPAVLPEDRKQLYPWIGYQSIEDKFMKFENLRNLARTEDVYVGETYKWRLGYSSEDFGASSDQLVFSGNYQNVIKADALRVFDTGFRAEGSWDLDRDEFENLWLIAEAQYYRRQNDSWQLFAKLKLDYARNLTADRQLTLGGSNGLRGYEKHYHVGDRSFLFTLEERYYSDWHLFNLIRIGGAVFLDVGRAWYGDDDDLLFRGSNDGILTNIGIGLRLSSSRAEVGKVIHFDLAKPLNKDDDVDSLQWLVTVKSSF